MGGLGKFWLLEGLVDADRPACTNGSGHSLSYGELAQAVRDVAEFLRRDRPRQMGVLLCTHTPQWLVAYLGALCAGHVPLLLPFDIPIALLEPLIARYEPGWVWRPLDQGTDFGPSVAEQAQGCFTFSSALAPARIHADLGLLLSTSGSTGSPKLVRLSYDALAANANSIATYLDLSASDRALTTLPGSYSYGLSVINSHLAVGACLVMKNVSLMSRDFLETVRDEAVTSLAGVPTWYQMLVRTGFDKSDTPSVRTFTQAGGRLDERTKRAVLDMANKKGARFFVMYGQTEATARISYVPPEALPEHLDSIGVPIPGGSLSLDPTTSELIYAGPNVMMGYAESLADLAREDECQGMLRTGDIGTVDDAGFFRVTGRLKRFVKLSGSRYGLDDIESQIAHTLSVHAAVTGRDERLGVWIEGSEPALLEATKALLQSRYQLHHSLYRVHLVPELPLTGNGKKDYAGLLQGLG